MNWIGVAVIIAVGSSSFTSSFLIPCIILTERLISSERSRPGAKVASIVEAFSMRSSVSLASRVGIEVRIAVATSGYSK